MKEEYYSLVAALFIPSSDRLPLNPTATLWEEWYLDHATPPPPRIARLIQNLELLHKTKDEIDFDRLQSNPGWEDDVDSSDLDAKDPDETTLNAIYDDDDDDMEENDGTSKDPTMDLTPAPSLEQIEATALDNDTGFYVQEALDTGCDYYKYFDNSPEPRREGVITDKDEEERRPIFLTHLSPHRMGAILEEATARSEAANAQSGTTVKPHVYLSWGPKLDSEIEAMA